MTERPPGTMFIHSRCCHAHWELVFQNGQYRLECEKCGEEATLFRVVGPVLEDPHCEVCGEGTARHDTGRTAEGAGDMTERPPGTMFFIYSRCCHAHWELVFQNSQ